MPTSNTPLTITSASPSETLSIGSTISVSSGFAVVNTYAASFFPTFSNQGAIISADTSGSYNGDVRIVGGEFTAGSYGALVINGAVGNTGALLSGHRYGVDFEAGTGSGNDESSDQLLNYGTIENTGGIAGFNAGVVFGFRAGGDVTNDGLISAGGGAAIYFKTDTSGSGLADSVLNTGTLESAKGAASVVVHDSTSSVNVLNTGSISDGVVLRAAAGQGTVTNAGTIGTIGGSTGLANDSVYDLTKGTLVLDAGQSLGGGIATFGAGSSLVLDTGSGGAVGTLVNTGSYIGFTTLSVASGADWAVNGSIAGVTTIVDSGTLVQTGTSVNSVFIDMGARDTLSSGSLPASFSATFGTLGTPSAPNVLDLSSATATSFAGSIIGFGANDQIDIGEFTSLPTGVSIKASGTTGSIGPVVVTGTVGGAAKSFTISNFTLAAGTTLNHELAGQQIIPGGSFMLASTSSGIALDLGGDSTVTLANTSPYTLGSGLTLAVPGANTDITNTGGATTLINNGVVSGATYGVSLTSSTAVIDAVTNTGTITHTGAGTNAGIVFGNNVGGSVYNSGYIGGPAGTAIFLHTSNSLSDTVTNTGTIGGNTGFSVVDGLAGTGTGQFTNTGSITAGVYLGGTGAGGTVINAGNIGTYAGNGNGSHVHIAIQDKAQATLLLDSGQTLNNGVVTFGAGSTLDLGAGTAGATGTIVNPGSYFGFTSLTVRSGADWSLGGTLAGVTAITDLGTLNVTAPIGATAINLGNGASNGVVNFSGTDLTNTNTITNAVTGFGPTDTIVIGGTNFATSPTDSLTTAYNTTTGALTVTDTNTGKSITVDVLNPTAGSASNFHTADAPGGGVIITDIPCFATGTRILTPDGETEVQNLTTGSTVLTARDGAVQKIIWTGQRTIDLTRHTNPEKLRPVRILAGAFSPGLPERDLVLSPDHCLFINNHLIEAKTLVNGATIIRDHNATTITYHHIELEQHDIVLAEGLPTETYLDSGNRQNFTSEAGVTTLHPDFTATSRKGSCAPMLLDGYIVRYARYQLLSRAISLGFNHTATTDLTAKAGAEHINPTNIQPGAMHFTLPANTKTVKLVSTTGVPAELSPDPRDRRTLGVAISGLALIANGKHIEINLNDTNHEGFHTAEGGHRWTNGNANIKLPEFAGTATLEVRLNGQAKRWTRPPNQTRAIA